MEQVLASEGECRSDLRSDAEDGMDRLTLSEHIALDQPADLPFPDGVHCFVTLDCSAGRFRRTESEARGDALLDEAVVLLNDVVQVG